MGSTRLLLICITVDIKVIVACSAQICKQTTTTVSKEMQQTHVAIVLSKNTVPDVSL